ncbi:GNAT family N-acetyltransferase [Clostridium paridis]|uniref:GNAT family N-acetyltransferase n=1 Tax=Clostridium paridis TaxID=2803863 RepID=A0A937K4B8_9CLOT|nr:GNAT family N-acetyltransferase [Clostridium paridis]MBL4931709.1 GNAT family N-acetyltransferase [Clostridium paridis]
MSDFRYEVRELKLIELKDATELIKKVFMKFEAPDFPEEGVETFIKFIESDSLKDEFQEGALRFFGCFDDNKIIGVIGTRKVNHICLLFVDREYHKQGIGKKLFEKVKESIQEIKITVNSSPYAVGFYHSLGFKDKDVEQLVDGIRFTPMEYIKE